MSRYVRPAITILEITRGEAGGAQRLALGD